MSLPEPVVPARLPNELWIKIIKLLRSDKDLPFLFVTCRQVNTTFRGTAESIVQLRALSKFRINFDLGYLRSHDEELFYKFEFDRLSEDGQTAILKGNGEEYEDEVMSVVRRRLRRLTLNMPIESPKHTIQVRRLFTDGPVPGLLFNDQNMEIHCDWKALFSAFFGEVFLYNVCVDRRKESLRAGRATVKKNEKGDDFDILKLVEGFLGDLKSAEQTARRARIKKQLSDLKPDWSFDRDGNRREEKKILKYLDDCTDFEEFSDDADGRKLELWRGEESSIVDDGELGSEG